MKTLASLLVIGALAFTSCARQDTRGATDASDTQPAGTDDPVVATEQPSAAGTGSASTSEANVTATTGDAEWSEIRGYNYDQRGEFNSNLNAMSARVEAEISELRAEASGADASASRRAALEEVQNAKSDFDEKSAALARASEDSWEQARDEAAAAWDRLQAALARARQEGNNE